jgi:hypothetical protein
VGRLYRWKTGDSGVKEEDEGDLQSTHLRLEPSLCMGWRPVAVKTKLGVCIRQSKRCNENIAENGKSEGVIRDRGGRTAA